MPSNPYSPASLLFDALTECSTLDETFIVRKKDLSSHQAAALPPPTRKRLETHLADGSYRYGILKYSQMALGNDPLHARGRVMDPAWEASFRETDPRCSVLERARREAAMPMHLTNWINSRANSGQLLTFYSGNSSTALNNIEREMLGHFTYIDTTGFPSWRTSDFVRNCLNEIVLEGKAVFLAIESNRLH